MNKPSVITAPNPILNKAAAKVTLFDDALKKQIQLMRQVLQAEGGVGLAANQIGLANQVLVIEYADEDEKNRLPFHALINPEIAESSAEKETANEGCLSVPQIELPVERAAKIKVKAQNETGKKIKFTANGLYGRIVQHETDHLRGILFTDRIRQKYQKDFPEIFQKKIVFVGTGDFAVTLLKGLAILGLNVKLVVSETAKTAGRHQNITASPIADLAKTFNQNLTETERIADLETTVKKINPDLIILADFGQKIPESILNIPKIAAVNLHPSLLPKYRGASPIQSAILAGEKETGVSLIKMVPEIDQGPILAQIKSEIGPHDTAQTLQNNLSTLALELLLSVLPQLIDNKLKEMAPAGAPTLTRKFTKADGEINWQKTPAEIERQIRAFYPWPGSFTFIGGKRLIIHRAHLEHNKLALETVQIEGRKPTDFASFLRGYHGPQPEWFSKIE